MDSSLFNFICLKIDLFSRVSPKFLLICMFSGTLKNIAKVILVTGNYILIIILK